MSAPDSPRDPAAEARKLPKTDLLLAAADRAGWVARLGHPAVVAAIRDLLDQMRSAVLSGGACPPPERIEATVLERLGRVASGSLRPVVNATGVVIHTNLGRAPLSGATLTAMAEVARGYVSL